MDTPDRHGAPRPTSRRAFIGRLGAGASAAVASTAGMADADVRGPDDAALRVALLEEEKVLRRLHQAFEQAMDHGRFEQVPAMFTADAEVLFNGGVFRGRDHGVSRLFRGRFAAGKSGSRMEPAPGFEPAADPLHDVVQVATDLRSASAMFPYSIQLGVPIETESSLAAMARLHGEGVRRWWEGGAYRIDWRREVDGAWKIARLEYQTQARADYRSGRRYALPITVARLATRFPQDPHGPDELV